MTSDSISARPTIIGMKILGWAEGLRAIPSSPAAIALPWPSAPPKDAIAMPNPAASAMKVLTLSLIPAAAPPSAAKATAATATKSSASRKVKETLRNIGYLPLPWYLDPAGWFRPPGRMSCRISPLMFLFVRDRPGDIDHRQHGEDERLHERDEHPQTVEDRGDDEGDQPQKDRHHEVVAGDVPEKTKGEGQRPGEVGDELDRQHDRSHPPDRPQEMLEVDDPVLLDAVVVRGQEDDDRQADGDVHLVGRRGEARDEPQQVHEEDEDEAGGEQGDVPFRLVPDDVLREGHEEGQDEFEQVARRESRLGDDEVRRLFPREGECGDGDEQDRDQECGEDVLRDRR